MKFASQLQAEKDRLGYSIAELSEALETSPRTIQHGMNGDRVPSLIAQEGALARLNFLGDLLDTKCRKSKK